MHKVLIHTELLPARVHCLHRHTQISKHIDKVRKFPMLKKIWLNLKKVIHAKFPPMFIL